MEKTAFIAKLVAASLFAAVAAAPAVRAADTGDSPKATQKAGAYIDDSVITTKVKAALVGDKQVSAMKIKVTTKDGVVTLKGTVPNAEVGQHALQLAAGIEGVKDVKSELTVKAS
ncbi:MULTISPECIES: BON domain-containing protein [unclassified Herbaspirillum]|uniref:BON domain-containing protein n=1 Tax=unclassified Herbaspirillum TaxID=2624150 RepID=UPI00114F83FD|nr:MULTISPECIES: BON domain-containing protein [unclassified Herbaspirillum]MBB5393869.1 hyperosmotically inducible protein [Herbaspirillum sp. SJZ102]TQK00093.1 hyperosmotically inducible protein [Herbaspirillum sp. SJZ130]TQK04582.1 hyperosmotically inducible protein [Herbaspirillum sp. SJZ106]TWC63155.1 hyperosmotically inducible protein [Herbaspirillum sp. SJZ099]